MTCVYVYSNLKGSVGALLGNSMKIVCDQFLDQIHECIYNLCRYTKVYATPLSPPTPHYRKDPLSLKKQIRYMRYSLNGTK